jgi:hypothetical protein
MMQSLIVGPKHWHDRADEARVLAEDMSDTVSKEMMLRIASEYDRLAKRAQERSVARRTTAVTDHPLFRP